MPAISVDTLQSNNKNQEAARHDTISKWYAVNPNYCLPPVPPQNFGVLKFSFNHVFGVYVLRQLIVKMEMWQ